MSEKKLPTPQPDIRLPDREDHVPVEDPSPQDEPVSDPPKTPRDPGEPVKEPPRRL